MPVLSFTLRENIPSSTRRAAPVKAFQGSLFQVYREEMEGLLGI